MRPNLKLILGIVTAAVCVAVVAAGMVFFSQQDHTYRLRLVQNQEIDWGYETIDSHKFGPLLKKYKTPYMGDAELMDALFQNLLLVRAGVGVGIDADTYTILVHYQSTEEELGPGNVHAALVYNSVAAFTLVDNLKQIRYFFPGNNFVYIIDRGSVEELFGTDDLSDFFPTESTWKLNFQDLLKQQEYQDAWFGYLFVRKYFDNPDFDGANAAAAGLPSSGNETVG